MKGDVDVCYSDDPIRDFERHSSRQEKWLSGLPKCSVCKERIQDEIYYDFYGEIVCEDCLADYCNDNYKKHNENL